MNERDPLARLIACLRRLPGVGSRSAERMAIRLAQERDGLLKDLIGALQAVERDVRSCPRCGSITMLSTGECRLCTNPNRDSSLLCVVEEPGDIPLVERSGEFHGRYHVLMGRLSPARGLGPENLRIRSLVERVEREGIREVLLALSTDMEGDATASFITELLKGKPVVITRLAFGLPTGSGVGYSDPITIGRAIRGRIKLSGSA
ncbi:MAG: recombination mediator RecR [Kiritimatiellae bacterium]|nr:recombination mediator RecR [Kiritimatiellia bacterium]